MSIENHISGAGNSHGYTLSLPDDCLGFILQFLTKYDDKCNSSLVCHHWLKVEGQARRRIFLRPQFDLIPSVFDRFNSITELSLIGPTEPKAILGRTALSLIDAKCKEITSLTRLTLQNCKIATCGVEALSKISARLEELHLKRVEIGKELGSGLDDSSLKVICLEDMDRRDLCLLAPLIKASKSLRAFKLESTCFANLSTLLSSMPDSVTEIYVMDVDVYDEDMGIISSRCPKLEILSLVKFLGKLSDAGIATVATKCRSLRKLHINDHWHRGQYNGLIWDRGLMDVARNCPNLEELVLDGIGVTELSLGMLGSKCSKLEELSICGATTVGCAVLTCIADKFKALKKLLIEYCPVSDHDINALATGVPNLDEVIFRECRELTLEGVYELEASRPCLAIIFDKDGRGRSKVPRQFVHHQFLHHLF